MTMCTNGVDPLTRRNALRLMAAAAPALAGCERIAPYVVPRLPPLFHVEAGRLQFAASA